MATNRPLPGDITVTGSDQASWAKWAANITDAVNELMTDHATFITLTSANKAAINAIIAEAAATDASFAGIGAITAVSASAVSTLSDTTAITLLRS